MKRCELSATWWEVSHKALVKDRSLLLNALMTTDTLIYKAHENYITTSPQREMHQQAMLVVEKSKQPHIGNCQPPALLPFLYVPFRIYSIRSDGAKYKASHESLSLLWPRTKALHALAHCRRSQA